MRDSLQEALRNSKKIRQIFGIADRRLLFDKLLKSQVGAGSAGELHPQQTIRQPMYRDELTLAVTTH